MAKKTFDEVDLPTNPNLPPWVLTPKEEKKIFERWRKKAFSRCDDMIKAYIDCSNKYPAMEAMKKCEEINKAQLDCVAKYQKIEYLDIERDLLIKEKTEFRKLYKQKVLEKQQQQQQQQQ